MGNLSSKPNTRKELKDLKGQRVKCSSKVELKIYDRTVFDGRNYSSYVLEKRLCLTNLRIYKDDEDKPIKYDHIWIMEDAFNQKSDFYKLLNIVKENQDKIDNNSFSKDEREISTILIEFEGTVTGYVKNNAYNEFTQKKHSNFDYCLTQIELINHRIIYKEKINKPDKKQLDFKGVVVKYDKSLFDVKTKTTKKNNPACVQRLIDIDRRIDEIVESDEEKGLKESKLNQLQHEIKKLKNKKLNDVCNYLKKHKTDQKIKDIIEDFHAFNFPE